MAVTLHRVRGCHGWSWDRINAHDQRRGNMDDQKPPKEPFVHPAMKKAQEDFDKLTREEPNGFIELEFQAKIIDLNPEAGIPVKAGILRKDD